MKEKSSTRDQIVETASRLFFSQGYYATGLSQIIKESDTPKGSLYYYFPDGKEQLAQTCINQLKEFVARRMECCMREAGGFVAGMQSHLQETACDLERNNYKSCGVAGFWNAVETSCVSDRLRTTCQELYQTWQSSMVAQLRSEGYEEDRATDVAIATLSLMEGAFAISVTECSNDALLRMAKLIPHVASQAT